tara:strand:+ start:654 stop:1349 length:696 start_codon:yes stop_codon:yes gene_type:complete
MKKILVTGGEGRFANILKKRKSKYKFIFRNKKQLNILNYSSIKKNISSFKPDFVLHLSGLSRPMKIHEKYINKSIDLNIIGTCNVVKACINSKIKIIYLSTSYVYSGKKGNYKENDPVLPWNNYGWSKLGGESAVQMYKNSLILRACMTEKPFLHKTAYANVKTNFIYHNDFINIFLKILNKKGVFNIGGKSQSVYNFAKSNKKNVKKIYSKGEFPLKLDMNLRKIKRFMK